MGSTHPEYRTALDALFARTGGHIKPGLQRTEALLDFLGDPHRKFPTFHVAGTNGKGSTCATLGALLQYKGLKVGRYSSPHLVDFKERIVVNNVGIDENTVLSLLDRLKEPAEQIGATFFEITTALAFAYFAEQKVDVAVIETGLGGRFDSTNVIEPLVATVTNISLDHIMYLGNTLEAIAAEKGGIFKFGRPAIIAEPRADLARQLANQAVDRGATPIDVLRLEWRAWGASYSGRGTTFTARTPFGTSEMTTPLYGEHQIRNTLTALATLHAAPSEYHIPISEWTTALSHVQIPGRFQRYRDWIFDVAHNSAGAQVLVDTLSAIQPSRPITVVLGVLGDKDWERIIDTVGHIADMLIVTQPASAPADRAWDPMKAALYASQRSIPVILEVSFDAALLRAQAQPGTKVVTGSFHTVGDALSRLGLDPLAIP